MFVPVCKWVCVIGKDSTGFLSVQLLGVCKSAFMLDKYYVLSFRICDSFPYPGGSLPVMEQI